MTRRGVLLLTAVALLAFTLRPPVASVGPVLPELRAGLGLGGGAAAVLTMLPVLCFGLLAAAAPWLARLRGVEAALAAALAVLTAGLVVRVLAGPGALFAGTVLVGAGIAIGNVLAPALVKRDFPRRTGAAMGVYTASVAGSAAVAAAATVPLGDLVGEGWRGALAVWAVPAAIALAVWLPRVSWRRPPGPAPIREPRPSMARSALAWHVTLFFGVQSMLFYATLAWLPSIYRDEGCSAAESGLILAVSGVVQIPVALVLPGLAARARSQAPHIVVSVVVLAAGLAGIRLAPTAAPYVWSTLLGVGCGACFALGLQLFVLRGSDVRDTARLSAMAQTTGYLVSAAGPLAFGLVHDVSGGWDAPLALLLAACAPLVVLGALAGRPRVVGDTRPSRQAGHRDRMPSSTR